MRVTVCELPDEAEALSAAWDGLRRHSVEQRSELLLLPEFAFAPPLWQSPQFDAERWAQAEAATDAWLQRLPELQARFVVGARPVKRGGKPYNEGFLWSAATGLVALRSMRSIWSRSPSSCIACIAWPNPIGSSPSKS